MNNLTGKQLSMRVKSFLELAQPLPVRYGYSRAVKTADNLVTYQDMGTSFRIGIGNHLVSERKTYTITVQTKTAENNLLYSGYIKHALEGTAVFFVSDDLRRDVTVKDGWINTIIVSVFNSLNVTQQIYDADQVRNILQEIADRYIFVTSIYDETLAQSFIDRYTVPQLTDKNYTYAEMLALKQQYLDKLLLTTTQY